MSNSITFDDDTEHDPLTGEAGDHVPLSLRWDLREFWPELCRQVPGLDETGAAVAFSLVLEATCGGQLVSYSRDKNREYRSPLYRYAGIMRAEEVLRESGHIDSWRQTPAEPNPHATSPRMRSTMRARQSLIDLVDRVKATCPTIRVRAPRDTIVLRRNGKEVRAPDTQKLNRDRRKLQRINEMLGSIVYSEGTSQLIQIFVNDLDSCGRLCADGGAWQNIETETRLASTIDGGPLMEFDYTNTHPSMLYQLAGLKAPLDSYEIEGFPRKLIKIAFNVLVNASNYGSAVGAVQHSKWSRRHFPDTKFKDARKLAMAAIRAVKDRHAPIARFFHQGVGLGLMRWESTIALDVMNKLEKAGVVSLPVHDAFLVEIRHRDRLLEEMRAAADKAGLPLMRIDRKLPEPKKTAEEKAAEATHELQLIQSVIAETTDSGWLGARRVSSLVVSELKPRIETGARSEMEIAIPVETRHWTISDLDALQAFFSKAADLSPSEAGTGTGSVKRRSEPESSKEILRSGEAELQGISRIDSKIVTSESFSSTEAKSLSVADLARLQYRRDLESDEDRSLPPVQVVHASTDDPGPFAAGGILGMTVTHAGRLRSIRFDKIMSAVRHRRPESIIVQETPMQKVYPVPSPSWTVPAYVEGVRLPPGGLRFVVAAKNAIRAEGLEGTYAPDHVPVSRPLLSLRTDEACADVWNSPDGPIVGLRFHGRGSMIAEVRDQDEGRRIAAGFLRQLAGTAGELPVVATHYGREIVLVLPADPTVRIVPVGEPAVDIVLSELASRPVPSRHRTAPASASASASASIQSAIPGDIGSQPHGAGKLLQAEAARNIAAAKAKTAMDQRLL